MTLGILPFSITSPHPQLCSAPTPKSGGRAGCKGGQAPPTFPRPLAPPLLGRCVLGGPPWADSQGPELGHVVEAGHGDGADIVVVQGPTRGRPESFSVCLAGSCVGRGFSRTLLFTVHPQGPWVDGPPTSTHGPRGYGGYAKEPALSRDNDAEAAAPPTPSLVRQGWWSQR